MHGDILYLAETVKKTTRMCQDTVHKKNRSKNEKKYEKRRIKVMKSRRRLEILFRK